MQETILFSDGDITVGSTHRSGVVFPEEMKNMCPLLYPEFPAFRHSSSSHVPKPHALEHLGSFKTFGHLRSSLHKT